MVRMGETRIFGGKRFRHHNSYYKKEHRDKYIRLLKRAGWNYRTTKTKTKSGRTMYNLYVRRRKK